MSRPSPLVLEFRRAIAAGDGGGADDWVLDLACGRGRNALALADCGLRVLALDRDPDALAAVRDAARTRELRVQPIRADLENALPNPLPLSAGRLGAVVVCRYLWRPLADALAGLLRPGGWLLYETFTRRQRDLGYGPRNTDFLLLPNELPGLFPQLEVVSHWEGLCDAGERPFEVARLAARRPPAPG